MPTGRITEWNRDRGFGYLESGKRRIFLHIRDFAEHYKLPEVGDQVTFTLGADRQGRPCALKAAHLNDGGRLRGWHFLLIGSLLILPGWALHQKFGAVAAYAAAWMAVVSALTAFIYYVDKQRARQKGQREPESMLHLLELLGGWPGAFLAQRKFRHKSSKGSFQFVFVLIIGLHQFLAIDALRGWPFIKAISRVISKLQ